MECLQTDFGAHKQRRESSTGSCQSRERSIRCQPGGESESISATAYEPASGKSSPVCHDQFDLPRTDWKIVGIDDRKAYAILDGNPSTAWHQRRNRRLPIDLGKERSLCGFRYFPDQGLWGPGIITDYEFYVSNDSTEWKLVSQGEFSNIKNNPLWQTKRFAPEKARYIKLRALSNTEGNDNIGYAEVDVITY